MEVIVLNKKQTPIEIALDIDETGHTTAKKLYEWLELRPADYSRWVKANITENPYAVEGIDYSLFFLFTTARGGRPTKDYLLTETFAKMLAMSSQTPKGEEARNYFLNAEENLMKAFQEP